MKYLVRAGWAVSCIAYIYMLCPYIYAAPDVSDCVMTKFKITGYYSPLSDQDFFVKGNYTDDVVLNGKGTHGASGKPVFFGMVAAPDIYDFGTTIYLPGIGVGGVEDRGGAIVEKGERGEKYNRIDIWMGKGELGLKRAMSFGVVYKDGYVCPKKVGLKAYIDTKNLAIAKDFFATSLWKMQLWKGRSDPRVGVLQTHLKNLGFFGYEVNNTFGDATKNALCTFQNTILGVKKTDFWCGYFGGTTRNALQAYLIKKNKLTPAVHPVVPSKKTLPKKDENGPIPNPKEETPLIITAPKKSSPPSVVIPQKTKPIYIQDVKNTLYLRAGETKKYQFLNDIYIGTKSYEVKLLQRKLQRMGYYKKNITGIYDADTKASIFAFQVSTKILSKDDMSVSRGQFGVKTREMFNKVR